jgi:hypothetical protein
MHYNDLHIDSLILAFFPMSLPYPRRTRPSQSPGNASGAMNFLQAHQNMARLLPTVKRLAALQKDCSTLMPAMFNTCQILHLEAGQLVVAVPNAALASKLKQQLPKLQGDLLKLGWQVTAIRIKVQVLQPNPVQKPLAKRSLSQQGFASLTTLKQQLASSGQNSALTAALQALLENARPENETPPE